MELGGSGVVTAAADPGILNHCESASTAVFESVPTSWQWLQLSVAWLA